MADSKEIYGDDRSRHEAALHASAGGEALPSMSGPKTAQGMGLRTFVADALTEILSGVMDAQANETVGSFVGNTDAAGKDAPAEAFLFSHGRGYTTIVRFDVAVTAADRETGGASGKAAIWVVSAELGRQAERRNETVSRLQFSVPVALPDPAQKAARRTDEREAAFKRRPPAKGII